MGTYIKLTCPNCKYIIQNYKLDNGYWLLEIGIPFYTCDNCGQVLIKKNVKEYSMLSESDIIQYYLSQLLCGAFLGFIVGLIIYSLNEKKVIFIIASILTTILYMMKVHKYFKKDIAESKKRLQDKDYAKIIDLIINKEL